MTCCDTAYYNDMGERKGYKSQGKRETKGQPVGKAECGSLTHVAHKVTDPRISPYSPEKAGFSEITFALGSTLHNSVPQMADFLTFLILGSSISDASR